MANYDSPDARTRQAGSGEPLASTPRGFGIRKVERPSAVKLTADALREEVFRIDGENMLIGSEEELISRLGVSRPTFRQAIGLLEHEQLIQSRRGAGGGFYTKRPTAEAVAHLASIHLFFVHATLLDLLRASMPIRVEAVRLIALNPDPVVRSELRNYLEQHRGFEALRDVQVNLRVRNGFELRIAELCGNSAVHLFLETGRHLGNVTQLSLENPMGAEPIARWIEFMWNIAEAIDAGDGDTAAAAMALHLDDLIARLSPAVSEGAA